MPGSLVAPFGVPTSSVHSFTCYGYGYGVKTGLRPYSFAHLTQVSVAAAPAREGAGREEQERDSRLEHRESGESYGLRAAVVARERGLRLESWREEALLVKSARVRAREGRRVNHARLKAAAGP